jgi:predicted nucleic acid-binding protein
MGHPSCLHDPSSVLVADASVVINMNATGRAPQILRAMRNPFVVTDVVLSELRAGRMTGRADADLTANLVKLGLVKSVPLGEAGLNVFEELVIGSAADTMDDGEAATLAYAMEAGAIAVIDERKANRIRAARFPKLDTACTIDLLAHPDILQALGRDQLADSIFRALKDARMRVMPKHVAWVVALIGEDLASQCASLPRAARTLKTSVNS